MNQNIPTSEHCPDATRPCAYPHKESARHGGNLFDENLVTRLRAGDSAAEEEIIVVIYRYFDQVARRANRALNGLIDIDDGKDMANTFFEKKRLWNLVSRYRELNATAFSKVFCTSMKNFATDWIRERIRKTPPGRSLDAPLPGSDGSTLADNIAAPPSIGMLTSGEMSDMLTDLKSAMLRNVGGDRAKAWILEAKIIKELKSQEVARSLPVLFPGKEYAVGSIDAIVSRFCNGMEAAAWRRKWFES